MSRTPPVAAAVWLAPTVGGLAVYGVVSAFVVEWQFLKEPTASRLKAKGMMPENVVAIAGLTGMLSPASWAFLAAFIGLPTTQLAWYSLLSTFGIGFWGWRYRRAIYAG
jgi:hypothetical protein